MTDTEDTAETNEHATYNGLIALLDEHGAVYRTIDHAPQGATELVSELRGNALAQAAKCIIVMVKLGKKTTKYVLAVVPGDRRLDLGAVKALFGGTYISFAPKETAERLAGSVSGTVLPFSFDEKLELIVDPALLDHDEIFFNAARLDRSLALSAKDYAEIAAPRIESITEAPAVPGGKRNIDTVMDAVPEKWLPHVLAQVNDYDVKVANVEGEFSEHRHADTDEFFLVLAGRLRLELPDGTVELGPHEVFTVPRGTLHKPVAEPGTRILMFEPRGTVNTGDGNEGTTGVVLP